VFLALALALVAGAGVRGAEAQTPGGDFPRLRVWAFPGAFQDSSLIDATRCVGSFGPRADSLLPRDRTVTLRILRDRRAEARADFGGYRVYRVEHRPDTSAMILLRRFTFNRNSEHTWNFSRLNPNTMEYVCPPLFETPGNPLTPVVGGPVVHDSVITFVDSDSNGSYQKVCRRVDRLGRCLTPGDSVFRLVAPPGPHDGFRLWYAVTYEKRNTSDQDNEDLFVPDTLDGFARCSSPADPLTCPNLNNRLANMLTSPVEPTGGPTENLETVRVVPNPFRGSEVWEQPGQSELHFVNLPQRSTIKIYTSAGDLVRVLEHEDPVRDFARWDLRNADGRDVASGIYMYRVEAAKFTFQSRFVVIR
jgi:hypothetical protein